MSDVEKVNHLISRLQARAEGNNRSFSQDFTDTVSIVSVQSSIFDLDSSLTSNNFKNEQKRNNFLPYKTKPFRFPDKMPENWLYSSSKGVNQNAVKREQKDPINWMRTIFDDEELPLSRSNLMQKLSKSQSDLSITYNTNNVNFVPFIRQCPIQTYKSTSDLKLIPADNLLPASEESVDQTSSKPLCKTAPGSTENIMDSRTSFQELLALAKEQEEKLKAEVLKRKGDLSTKSRDSTPSKVPPSVRHLKYNKPTTQNSRFGFIQNAPQPAPRSKSASRYSKNNQQVVVPEQRPSVYVPRMPTVQRSTNYNNHYQPKTTGNRIHYNSVDPAKKLYNSVDNKKSLRLYHV